AMAYDESPGAGSLFRLELHGTCTTVLTGLTISNGIGWSPDGTTMYLNDGGTGCIETFRFDQSTGALSERRTLVRIDQPGVVPDGLTVLRRASRHCWATSGTGAGASPLRRTGWWPPPGQTRFASAPCCRSNSLTAS